MSAQGIETLPQRYVRIGGLLYLVLKIAGIFAIGFVRFSLVNSSDPAGTARNLLASESLWRSAFASLVLLAVCYVAVALIFYVLFRPVSKPIALLAAFFDLVGSSICALSALGYLGALWALGGDAYLKAFDAHQLQALALLSIKAQAYGYHISLIFFGAGSLLLASLMLRSTYFPKALSALPIIGALSYLVSSIAVFVLPNNDVLTSPLVLAPGFFAEVLFSLWLLIVGAKRVSV